MLDDKTLTAVYDLSLDLSGTTDRKTIYSKVVNQAVKIVGGDGGSLMILKPGTDEMSIVEAAGTQRETVIGKIMKIGERVSGRAAKEKKPILVIGDVSQDARFKSLVKYETINSGMAVPIMFKDSLVGVINLKRTEKMQAFTDTDVKLAYVIGLVVAPNLK